MCLQLLLDSPHSGGGAVKVVVNARLRGDDAAALRSFAPIKGRLQRLQEGMDEGEAKAWWGGGGGGGVKGTV